MLVEWTIENFKSIGSKLALSLSPVTVLVGANSSGKSSIIQSILLIKQTLQYATPDRPIALNGPLLKLGNFNDVKNVQSKDEGFRIGWKYEAAKFAFPALFQNLEVSPVYSPFRGQVSTVKCETHFGVDTASAPSALSLLQPILFSSFMSAAAPPSDEEKSETAVLEIQHKKGPLDETLAKLIQHGPYVGRNPEFLHYSIVDVDHETKEAALEDHPSGEIVGAVVRHFLPSFIAIKYDTARRRAMQVAEAICSLRRSLRFQREYANLPASAALVSLIDEWLKSNQEFFSQQASLEFTDSAKAPTIGNLVDKLFNLRNRVRWARTVPSSFPSLQDLQPKIFEAVVQSFPSQEDIDFERPRLIYDATQQMREYFENYVRYLGPLRDQPKPLYPLESVGNPTDVGYRGEHTAAVLHLNRFRNVEYISSANFSDSPLDTAVQQHQTVSELQTAVVDWLSYMGVVDDVSTSDRGKIGHELQVKTPGIEKFHDLTNVGVGVSQVLPIVLMALLAPTGSLLILEQPELHLHPRVQTRLADFFISIAMSGKQCLLETHSEYLIHRLRRRIAEAPGDSLVGITKLYFVERDGGLTSCRAVDITKYGAIIEWPVDFFDQAQVESEGILAAASSKRMVEKNLNRKKSDEAKSSS